MSKKENCKRGRFGGLPKIDASPEDVARALFGGDRAVKQRREKERRQPIEQAPCA